MNRIAAISVFACLIATSIVGTSCTIGTAPIVPDKVAVTVDSTAYHLQPAKYSYAVNITVTVVNSSSQDIYLGQFCGYWSVWRVDGSRTELGAFECALASSGLKRLVIRPGERHVETYYLPASVQPQARPQVTLEDNLGTMVIRYQFVDSDGRKSELFDSTPFEVLPPL